MTPVRDATGLDRDAVREIYMRAFPQDEGQLVSMLAVELLSIETTPETISLVAEADGKAVGHIAFSPVTISTDIRYKAYILAPLAVQPEYQKRRIGTRLVEYGKERLSKMGVHVLFVYGDPDYYGKFGFDADTASGFVPPFKLQYPFGWQAMTLGDSVSAEARVGVACVEPLMNPGLW